MQAKHSINVEVKQNIREKQRFLTFRKLFFAGHNE